jgi:hypothetical protein
VGVAAGVAAADGVTPAPGVAPVPHAGTCAGVPAALMTDAGAVTAGVVRGTDAGAATFAEGVGAGVVLATWGAGVSPGVLPAAMEAGEPKAQPSAPVEGRPLPPAAAGVAAAAAGVPAAVPAAVPGADVCGVPSGMGDRLKGVGAAEMSPAREGSA